MRNYIYQEIKDRCQYQDQKWGGPTYDDKHTTHDWVAFIARYLGRAVMWPFSPTVFRKAMLDIAALATQAIAWTDRNSGQWRRQASQNLIAHQDKQAIQALDLDKNENIIYVDEKFCVNDGSELQQTTKLINDR